MGRRAKIVLWSLGSMAAAALLFFILISMRDPDFRYDRCWVSDNSWRNGTRLVERNGKKGAVRGFWSREIIPCIYDRIIESAEGYFAIQIDGKWGFLSPSGEEMIPTEYDNLQQTDPFFSEGLVAVKLGDKWGYINMRNETVIPFRYDYAQAFSDRLACVSINGKHGFIDTKGITAIPFAYDAARSFSEGLAAVARNGKFGFIDKSGRVVIPLIYQDAYDFYGGFARVWLNNLCGLINKQGEKIVPTQYSNIADYDDLTAIVVVEVVANGKNSMRYGLFDMPAKMAVTPVQFNAARLFCEERAAVQMNGKWGFIDTRGEEVIPCKYDYATDFDQGKAYVGINHEYYHIDKQGARIEE